MGGGSSVCYRLPPPPPPLDAAASSDDFPYFVLMFQMPCGIRIGLADKSSVDAVRRGVLNVVTTEGIEFEGSLSDDSYKIRLFGSPFAPISDHKDALMSRKVATRILQELYAIGWRLMAASDLSRSDDLSTWFFKRHSKRSQRPLRRMVCVGLSASDTLQMVGDFDDTLKVALKSAIETGYGPGLQTERQPSSDYYEAKLRGYPWAGNASREEGVWARRVLLQIIRFFHEQRFEFYGTVNLKGTADALFFIEEEGGGSSSQKERIKMTMSSKSLSKASLSSSRTSSTTISSAIGDVGQTTTGDAHFCAMSLDRKDRLTMIDCPPRLVACVRDAISSHWKGGLQDEYNMRDEETKHSMGGQKATAAQLSVGGAKEFKLKGYPWWAEGSETVVTRSFMTKLFQSMLAHGYAVIGALDISRHFNDKAVFIMRSHEPVDLAHVCLSMHDVDKIRLINCADDSAFQTVHETIGTMWPYGLAEHNANYYGCYEWTLKNQPWSSFGRSNKPLIARVLMCYLLRAFIEQGWTLLAAADISAKYVASSAGPDFSCDVDSWFFADTRKLGGALSGFKS